MNAAKKPLSVFALTMMNIVIVGSLQMLTSNAVYGYSLLFFYALAIIFFFIPTILITAELATSWPVTGGAYIWVERAFGKSAGFFTACIQWLSNLIWYPTIFALIATGVLYLIAPQWLNNKVFMLVCVTALFWVITLLNCYGIRLSSFLSSLSSFVGIIIPTLVVIALSIIWIKSGKPSQIVLNKAALLPSLKDFNNIAFLIEVIISLVGIEMSAAHAGDVKNPQRNYPLALIYSALAVIVVVIGSALAIAIVIPSKQIGLVSGLLDAIKIFATNFHLLLLLPLLVILITVGNFGCASSWMMSSTRSMFVACCDGKITKFLQKTNRFNAPVGVLLLEAIIFTVVSLLFVLMPSVNASYWVLLALASQIALIYYILLFAAAVRLRYKHTNVVRHFTIPGRKAGIWLVALMGCLAALIGIVVGFIPPQQTPVGSPILYDLILIIAIIVACLIPLSILWCCKARHYFFNL